MVQISNKNSLIWFSAHLEGQEVPAMLDSGANPNCISLRCVNGSQYLKRMKRYPYSGKQMVDANDKPIEPAYVIKCNLRVGNPTLLIKTEFVVIASLPFSCIVGQQTLRTLDSWEVSNVDKIITFNKNCRIPFHDEIAQSTIQLITTQKMKIEPFTSAVVSVRATGHALNTFRPESEMNVVVEGNTSICERLSIEVLPSINVLSHQNCMQKLKVHNLSPKPKFISKGTKLATCSNDYDICDSETIGVNLVSEIDPIDMLCSKITDLDPKELTEAREVLRSYEDIFTVSNKRIGHTNIQQFDVDEANIEKPVTVPLRRIPIHHREIVQRLIDKYEQLHLLEPIESPYRASTVLIEKKNLPDCTDVTDKYRLCTDYRALNKHLISSGWPSPSLDDCLDAVNDANMFSSIDFNMGYYQIPCTEKAKQVLAFSPGYGFKQYTWSVMPPGVKTASSCFQQAMSRTFNGHEDCILPPFYDDVTIKGKGFRQHIQNVKIILDDVRAANFTLNALKCSLFQRKIKYLGHMISEHSIELDPERTQAIVNLPPPQDTKGLRRFIGMVQFCHKFIKHLNVVLAPLYDLLKNKQKFVWSIPCQNAFDKLKKILSTPPVLYSPTTSDKFILETDASDIGLGGCLKAKNGNGSFIVGYCSKKFVDNESGWNIVEKEAFAIVYSVKHFHHFLAGQQFTIRCDNRVVCYVKDKRKPRNKKLLGWALELSDYDYEVQHIPSKNNNIADCLSRLMCISVNTLSHDEFLHEQSADVECCEALLYLEAGRKGFDVSKLGSLKRHRKHLQVVNDVLMWKSKYVVPHGLRKKILELCHDHPMAGHFAADRTYQRFSEKYFWPGASSDVEKFVNSCQKCNEFNQPRTTYVKAPLQPIETTHRFELVCYDLAGPFHPKTVRGNCYVLIIVDHFTHWPEFVALRDTTAPTIATALFEHWCCRYGPPERFHSDGAKNVHGQVIKELCKHFGVDKTKSSRLHPQGDGMAESFVKQLKSCIQKQVEANGSDWDLYIQATAFAVRSNIAYNTKVSPAELMIGTKLSQPLDQVLELSTQSLSQKQGALFAKDLKNRIQNSQRLVNKQLNVSRDKMKVQYDKTAKPSPFKIGDTVMLWKPYKRKGLSGCFQPKWDGPWSIVKFTGQNNMNCKIINCAESSKTMNVHVNQLKLVKHHSEPTIVPTDPSNKQKNSCAHTERVMLPKPPTIGEPFLHYLDDFDYDNRVQNMEQNVNVEIGQVDEHVPEPVAPQIDRRWVEVDESNIMQGNRTRGVRPDYRALQDGD